MLVSPILSIFIFLLFKGLLDGNGTNTRFNQPQGCTAFGDKIAIADYGNDAIRTVDIVLMTVESLVKHGSQSSPDGVYTGSSTTGGGVDKPIFIESLNRTHLIILCEPATVRMINTDQEVVSTLISDSWSQVSIHKI